MERVNKDLIAIEIAAVTLFSGCSDFNNFMSDSSSANKSMRNSLYTVEMLLRKWQQLLIK